MRTSLYFKNGLEIATIGALILCAFFWLCPESVFAENGELGRISRASTGLILVVPEHFEPLKVGIQDNQLITCGFISSDVSFLSINGDKSESLEPRSGASGCKSGETYVSSVAKEGTTIFVPNAAL